MTFLYTEDPGEVRAVFNKIDLINLPNAEINLGENVMREKLHVMSFLYDDDKDAE